MEEASKKVGQSGEKEVQREDAFRAKVRRALRDYVF